MGMVDWWKTKPQRDAARSLLRAEVDSNLKLLQDWWGKLKPRKGEDEIHWVDKVVYAREFADAALPDFSRNAYMRYQPRLSQYLRGAQLKGLAQFYQDLDRIAELQQELRDALEKDLALRRSPEGQPSSAGEFSPRFDNFLRIAPWSWREASRLIDQLQAQGNPLGKRRS
jgi:hypothetical protein